MMERGITGNSGDGEGLLLLQGLDAEQPQETLHDGALSVCGEAESSSCSTQECVSDGKGLQEGVSEGEEAEPLQDGDEHSEHAPVKECSVKLMDCRTAPTLNSHIAQEDADDTVDGVCKNTVKCRNCS